MRLKTPLATHLLSARLEAVCRRFERWRRTRKHRSPIPEALWGAAVTVARECGLHRTAQTLRLNYDALKERVEAAGRQSPRGQETKPTFVELVSPAPNPLPECTVELEHPSGARMRIHLNGAGAPHLAALTSTFWSGKA